MGALLQETRFGDSVNTWPDRSTGAWFVLRTRSRQEKILSRELIGKGVEHFLPLMTCTRFYGGRKPRVEVPLFPGYLFLHGSLDDAYAVDRSGRVAQIILVPNQELLDVELRNIHAALHVSATLNPYPYLSAGVRVQVREGPMRGIQGVIEQHGARDRLVLQVQTLGQAVSLEIEASLLEPAD
jgi:transcriptional antiterminator RfaH